MSGENLATGRGILLGLIGAPIRHSAAPAMHEAAAKALGLRGFYHLIEVQGADEAGLRAMLQGVQCLGFAGVNVTYPYKEAVVALLDDVTADAASIGAVNTVVVDQGRLIGHNTDATGFARACTEVFGSIAGQTICLIGAGGVGKAIGSALAAGGAAHLRIFDQDAAKAETLAQVLQERIDVRACGTIDDAVNEADGLVNGTPVGMLPNRDTPVPIDRLRQDLWVADVVYSPLWTPLLQAARGLGARTMTGRELTIHQAMDAFLLFTGVAAPPGVMSAAFDAVIKGRATPSRAA